MRSSLVVVLFAGWLVGCPPAPACDESSCTGCCAPNAMGVSECFSGTSVDACGRAAGACSVCSSGLICSNRQCVTPTDGGVRVPDAGRDGGDGGDAGRGDGGVPDAGYLAPSAFTVGYSADRSMVELRWTNVTHPDLANVKVLRRLDQAPTGPNDPVASVVFESPGSMATHDVRELAPTIPYRSYTGGSKPALADRLGLRQPRQYFYAAYGCTATDCDTEGPVATFQRNLTEALQKGGFTIFWRHASASTCLDDSSLGLASAPALPNWWKACRTTAAPTACGTLTRTADGGVNIVTMGPFARQLTDPQAGEEITRVRTYLEQRQIPFSRALSSEYCRCSETARGYFAHLTSTVPVQETADLTLTVYGNRCTNVVALTATPPAPGTNVGIVSHSGMGCPTDALAWSQAAIFRPVDTGVACPCADPEQTCVTGTCWRRELTGTIFDDEWVEIPTLP